MKSLRELLVAETKYQTTIGKGDFGEPKDLLSAGLIDDELARGLKNGYRFTVVIKKSTLTTPAAVDLIARPSEYGKSGRRSFYLTESGVMLTSEEKDAPLANMKPFAIGVEGAKTNEARVDEPDAGTEVNESEFATIVSTNEATVIAALGAIHAAQTKFVARDGGGAYGTLAQLEKAGLINKSLAASTQNGYLIEVTITAGKPELPAAFKVSAVPERYGTSGRRSFYVDQTGLVRGADKEGGSADETDPTVHK